MQFEGVVTMVVR